MSKPTLQGVAPTVVCVAAAASPKPVNSQLDDSRALNSDAMIGCVARTMDPSALETNTAGASQVLRR